MTPSPLAVKEVTEPIRLAIATGFYTDKNAEAAIERLLKVIQSYQDKLDIAVKALENLVSANEERESYFRRRVESPSHGPELAKELWDKAKEALSKIRGDK